MKAGKFILPIIILIAATLFISIFIMFFLKLHWILCGDVCVFNDMYYNSCGVINMKDNNYESYLFKDIFWYIGIKSLKIRKLINLLVNFFKPNFLIAINKVVIEGIKNIE